jgi:small subunit ribosomal protein S15
MNEINYKPPSLKSQHQHHCAIYKQQFQLIQLTPIVLHSKGRYVIISLVNIRRNNNLDKVRKTELITGFGINKNDTGSADVQVALITERITRLTEHLSANRHDFATQRGLYGLVGQRRRLLTYLAKEDVGRYRSLISKLGLRK